MFISPSGEPFRTSVADVRPVDAWFARADSNHDGALSAAEFQADALAFLHTLDANRDGVIDGFEISDYEQNLAPEILPPIARLTARDIPPFPNPDRRITQLPERPRPVRRGPAEPSGAAALGLIREPEPVTAADTDFDGKVSQTEMAATARRRFAKLDLDHDGRIARTELPLTPAEAQAEKAERKRKPPPR